MHRFTDSDRVLAIFFANALFLNKSTPYKIARYLLATYATVIGIASVFIIGPESKLVAALLRSVGANIAMKALDLHFSRGTNFHPVYDTTGVPRRSDFVMPSYDPKTKQWSGIWRYARKLTTSLRYDDFDISVIKHVKFTHHPMRQALLSVAILGGIASTVGIPPFMTIDSPVLSAFFFLLALHATFCGFHFIPGFNVPLFEKHFLAADNLSEFWTKHWHGLFTSPIKSLAFTPFKRMTHSNAAGLCAAMAFSGLYHWFVVAGLEDDTASFRVFWFFALQGPGCIVDYAIWGRRKRQSILRRVFAWVVMLGLASWVVRGFPSVKVTNDDITWLAKNVGRGRI